MFRSKIKKYTLQIFFMIEVLTGSCQEKNSLLIGGVDLYETPEFKKYWYAGKAEINAYNLNQSRYGENRTGKAVLIFVSEDFSKNKQVKLDDPTKAGSDKVNVLKMNFTKNFVTGIYPYSMMLSVFTPVDHNRNANSLKASMSSQEWCGHVFSQLNLKGGNYEVKSYSYFEQESDVDFVIKKILLEDEIWNIIRIDHEALPTGSIEVVPGLFFTRLKHVQLKPQRATAVKTETSSIITYVVAFLEQERKLSIRFEKKFPYKILGWDETFKERDTVQRTTATLDKTMNLDYWTKNKIEFEYLRDSLHLPNPQ